MVQSIELASVNRRKPKDAPGYSERAPANDALIRDAIALARSGKQQVLTVRYLELFHAETRNIPNVRSGDLGWRLWLVSRAD